MSDPVIPNCIAIRMLWSDPVGRFMNVLHAQYAVAGPLSPSIAENLFAAFKTSLTSSGFLPFVAATTSFTGVDVRDLRAANNPLIDSTGPAMVGTPTEPALPPHVAMVATYRTAQAGRAFRGRSYMGGLALSAGDPNGRVMATANAAMVDFLTAVKANIATQSGTMAIAQRALPDRPGHGGITLPARQAAVVPITTITARDTIFDTQRRRSGAHVGSR